MRDVCQDSCMLHLAASFLRATQDGVGAETKSEGRRAKAMSGEAAGWTELIKSREYRDG